MSNYWMIAVMIAVLMGGLSDVSRIQKLEAQNQELISRLNRLERVRPPAPSQTPNKGQADREDEDELS